MSADELHAALAEFFRDSFAEDAAGVGDWLAQSGQDADEFVAALDKLHPTKQED